MSKETKYKKKKGISSQRLGQDLMLYDSESDKVHVLNETGAIIWELLDGKNTMGKIEKILAQRFDDASPQDISKDIEEILRKLEKEGLIIPVS